MSFTVDEVIIILSEDEDLACDDTHNDSSVLFVEEKEKVVPDRPLPAQALEEDLVVTFSRRAEVLPHARYDCPVYPFTRADFEKTAPIDANHLICEQCFCYVCDKLASLCSLWRVKDMCHCNSHQRSELWSGLRSSAVLGHLLAFNFSLSDLDGHLRLAEMLLRTFRKELGFEFSRFLQGKMDGLQRLVYDYTPVYECVSSFLNKADEQEGKVAAIMSLGASQDFTGHYQPSGIHLLTCYKASATEAKGILLQRVVASVRRVMVMSDLPSAFIHKLHGFFQRLNLPCSFRHMRQSLSVRPWDDVLLVSILKGQNVTGVRRDRGKKDVLLEEMAVVLLRFELLQCQRRYRELCRYLSVVQTDKPKLFQELRDLAPLFLCMTGDFSGALSGLFGTAVGPATRLSPALFRLYLRVFDTATAPGVLITPQTQQLDLPAESPWGPIQGTAPLKRTELVKFALRVQRSCAAVNADAQSWAHLLAIVNTPRDSPSPLPEPSAYFLKVSKTYIQVILSPHQGTSIQIPKSFLVFPDHALLLLVTEALVQRIVSGPLSPSLPVINIFKENPWALRWFCQNLSLSPDVSLAFMTAVQQELVNTGDNISYLPLQPSSPPPSSSSSSPEPWDHTYSSPEPVKPCSSKVQSRPQWRLPEHLWSNNGL